jgi:hypothetical protein
MRDEADRLMPLFHVVEVEVRIRSDPLSAKNLTTDLDEKFKNEISV